MFLKLIAAFAVTAAVFASSAQPSIPVTSMSVTPGSVDYGTVPQGYTSSEQVSVTNTGHTPLWMRGFGIEGGPFAIYEWDDTGYCPIVQRGQRVVFEILPGDTCTVDVFVQTAGYSPGYYGGALLMYDENLDVIVDVPLAVTIV